MIRPWLWLRWRWLCCSQRSFSFVRCACAELSSDSWQNCSLAGEVFTFKRRIPNILPILALTMLLTGCGRSDERFVRLSEQSVARQAEQNRQMAQQSQQVAEATHTLVEADAKARAELIQAQRDLETGIQAERGSLDQQRQKLEQDRQTVAAAREREPLIAEAIGAATSLLAVVASIVLCIHLVRATNGSSAEQDLNELLLTELIADQPSLLLPPSPPRADQLPAPLEQQEA